MPEGNRNPAGLAVQVPSQLCGVSQPGKKAVVHVFGGLKTCPVVAFGGSWGQQPAPFYSHSMSRCQPLSGVVISYILWSEYPPTQAHPMAKLPRTHMYHRSTQLRAREKAVGLRGAEAESWRPDIAGRRIQEKSSAQAPVAQLRSCSKPLPSPNQKSKKQAVTGNGG